MDSNKADSLEQAFKDSFSGFEGKPADNAWMEISAQIKPSNTARLKPILLLLAVVGLSIGMDGHTHISDTRQYGSTAIEASAITGESMTQKTSLSNTKESAQQNMAFHLTPETEEAVKSAEATASGSDQIHPPIATQASPTQTTPQAAQDTYTQKTSEGAAIEKNTRQPQTIATTNQAHTPDNKRPTDGSSAVQHDHHDISSNGAGSGTDIPTVAHVANETNTNTTLPLLTTDDNLTEMASSAKSTRSTSKPMVIKSWTVAKALPTTSANGLLPYRLRRRAPTYRYVPRYPTRNLYLHFTYASVISLQRFTPDRSDQLVIGQTSNIDIRTGYRLTARLEKPFGSKVNGYVSIAHQQVQLGQNLDYTMTTPSSLEREKRGDGFILIRPQFETGVLTLPSTLTHTSIGAGFRFYIGDKMWISEKKESKNKGSRFRQSLTLGISMQRLTGQPLTLSDQPQTQPVTFAASGLTLNTSYTLEYHLSRKLGVTASPFYTHRLESLTKSNTPFKLQWGNTGVEMGLTWRIR